MRLSPFNQKDRKKIKREKLNSVIQCSLGSYFSIHFIKHLIDKICVGGNADPAPHRARERQVWSEHPQLESLHRREPSILSARFSSLP